MSHIQSMLADENKYVVIPNYVRVTTLYHRTMCLYEQFRYGTGPYDDVLADPNKQVNYDQMDGYSFPNLGILPTLLARDSILLEMMYRLDRTLTNRAIYLYKQLQKKNDKTDQEFKTIQDKLKQMNNELKWIDKTISKMECDITYTPQTLIWGKQVSEIQTYMDNFSCLKTIIHNLERFLDQQVSIDSVFTDDMRNVFERLDHTKEYELLKLENAISYYKKHFMYNDKSQETKMETKMDKKQKKMKELDRQR
eukprot:1740877-Rhodomonas_salina.1